MSTSTPGRPAIGPKVPINFPELLLQDIDQTAESAGLSRAAWIRRACARALPETYEGAISPAQMAQFLSGARKGEDLDNPDRAVHVNEETRQRLLHAVEHDCLTIRAFTTESIAVETTASLQRLSFITRKFQAGRDSLTIYQVTYTTRASGGSEGFYRNSRWLFLDEGAARAWYEECREEHMRAG